VFLGKTIKAVVFSRYGPPDVLYIKDAAEPVIKEKEVLVRMHASSLNAGDIFPMRGYPWAARLGVGFPQPKDYIPGWDMAGRVEAVGNNVTRFSTGDEVFAACSHALAEYVMVVEDKASLKPSNLTFHEAAAVPTAAVTALQLLRDIGKVRSGRKVLINGASERVKPLVFRSQARARFGWEHHSQQRLRRYELRFQGISAVAVHTAGEVHAPRFAEWKRSGISQRTYRNRRDHAGHRRSVSAGPNPGCDPIF